MAQIDDLLNQASEIRDAEQDKENTALRVGTMLVDILQYIAGFVSVDDLQTVLADYAPLQGALVHWRNSRVVCLASMGSDLDNIDGGDWQYTNHAGDIVFDPSGRYLSIVGEQGHYSIFPGVFYVNLHSHHCYVWDATTRAMIEITDSSRPTIIDYRNNPPFDQVAIGESYYFESGSAKKIAIKTSSSDSYSFDPDPKKIYVFKDTCESMIWNATTRSWIAIGKNIEVVDNLTEGGRNKALSAEMGKELARMISNAGSSRVLEQRVAIIAEILQNAVFTSDQSQRFEDLAALEDAVDSITLNVSSHTFNGIGGTFTLVATTVPSGKSVRWESSNPAVATVDGNGVVTPVSYGPCVITAKAGSNNVAATCSITVQQFQVDSVSIDQSDILLDNETEGYTKQLTATTMYNGQVVQAGVTWSSSNPGVATIDANTGLVTVVGNGQTTITATSGTESDTITIRVSGVVHEFHISLGTLSNVTVEDGDGNAIANGHRILERSSLIIKLVPAANYEIATASVTMDGVAQTLTDNQDGSKSVALTVSGDIEVSASATYVEKDYAKASDVVDVEGYGIIYISNGAYRADSNYKHSRIIPLDFGKTYLLSGFNWASAEVVAGGCNIALLKKTGSGTAASDFENIINGTDVTKPNNMMADSFTWDANGNIYFQSYNTPYASRNNIIFSAPPASAFSGVEKVYLCVNYAFAAKSFDPANLSVKEIPSMNEADYNYIGIINNYYLQTDQYAVIGRIIPLDFGKSYEYSGYNVPEEGNISTAYNIGLVANAGGIFRSLTQQEVTNIDSFFSHASYATRTSVPSTGSFTAPARDDVPAGVDKIFLAVTLKFSTFADLSESFTFNEAQ